MKNLMFLILPLLLLMSSCEDGIALFSIEDDKAMGAQVAAEIANDPSFVILPESSNAAAYAYLNNMKNQILNGGEVKYANEFVWQLSIIDDDATLNAFATPGGYIYVYTGLIKYLDDASSLAGVMGHEIGHADGRHSSKQMQKQYGVVTLLQIVTGGEPGALAQLAANLLSLSFSRSDETDADNRSVQYLCPTDFEADGAAKFFEKIEAEGNPSPPQFLSTHPNPSNRIENLHEKGAAVSCGTELADPMINGMTYDQFKSLF
ncbi:MAG: M48 family metalloprotease [Chitinophagales bacterium]|nr:M48 family metalloprotease [Chitinophagales bacterium]